MYKPKIERGSVFERYETKYLMDSRRYQDVFQKLTGQMQEDQYGLHTICTLYYDTNDFAVIRACLDKPKFREKLRMRSYGVPGKTGTVYLELKKKMAGITYKRRVALPLYQANAYMRHGRLPVNNCQIFKEIDWFVSGHALEEKALLCYDRIAMFGREDETLRITFDSNIRWRDYDLSLEAGDYGAMLLPKGSCLMEIKTAGALPCWLSRLLSEQSIYPISFSKYGTIYTDHLCGKEVMRHAV